MKKILLLASAFYCFLNLANAQAGQPDPSFGDNGIVRTSFGASANVNGASGRQVLTKSDGTIYLIFQIYDGTVITRLLNNGSIDTSYGIKGYSQLATINWYVVGLFQDDGKIVLAGTQNFNFVVARYNTNGTLDTTFGGDGQQSTPIETQALYAFTAGIERDGTIVLAGALGREPDDYFLGVARFNNDGSPDTTFWKEGKLIRGMGDGITYSNGMTIQPDGKIVVTSERYWGGGRAVIQRFNRDGTYDNGFSEDGIADLDFYLGFVAIQNDGKLVLGPSIYENRTSNFPLARYNADGTPDSTFSDDAKQTTDFLARFITIQSDGKLVLAGGSSNDFTVERYNTDGSIDSTFGENGKQTTDFDSSNDNAYNAAVQSDGKILLAGSSGANFALARYNPDGSPDNTLSEDGKLSDYIRGGTTYFTATALQSDGKIVAVGRANTGGGEHFALARYNTDGTPDTAFSNDGKQTTNFGLVRDYANAVRVQGDGKIVVAGFAYNTTDTTYFALARYNPDGSPDTTFSQNGKKIANTVPAPRSVKISGDGKILVVGRSVGSNYFTIARHNANGTLDSTFSDDGIQKTTVYGDAYTATVQNDGKIVLAGRASARYQGYNSLISRLNADGSVDSTFSEDGLQNTDFNLLDDYASLLAIQSDGKIIAAGAAGTSTGLDFGIARYNTDGSVDSTFSEDGKQTINFSSDINYANAIVIQDNGKIVIGGRSPNNFSIARLNKNGILDSSFGTQGKQVTQVTEGINGIASMVISGNSLYAVGSGQSVPPVGVIVKYQLDNDSSQTPPAVSLSTPANNATYLAPAAHIKLTAAASDSDGTVSKVEFYNGTALLDTETVAPYGFVWRNVPLGNYTITAKATDNSGLVTTSAAVHISVVANKAPTVSITNSANTASFTAPATIPLTASAQDSDGRITNVKFYNGTTLLRTERKLPYTYNWENVPAGTYTITAVATDNWGAQTTSAPVTVTVASNAMIVSSKPSFVNNKTGKSDAMSLNVYPNPAGNIVNIYIKGFQQNKRTTISVISASGTIMKAIQSNGSTQAMQLNVSSLVKGVYTIKIISGEEVMYKQFVKL